MQIRASPSPRLSGLSGPQGLRGQAILSLCLSRPPAPPCSPPILTRGFQSPQQHQPIRLRALGPVSPEHSLPDLPGCSSCVGLAADLPALASLPWAFLTCSGPPPHFSLHWALAAHHSLHRALQAHHSLHRALAALHSSPLLCCSLAGLVPVSLLPSEVSARGQEPCPSCCQQNPGLCQPSGALQQPARVRVAGGPAPARSLQLPSARVDGTSDFVIRPPHPAPKIRETFATLFTAAHDAQLPPLYQTAVWAGLPAPRPSGSASGAVSGPLACAGNSEQPSPPAAPGAALPEGGDEALCSPWGARQRRDEFSPQLMPVDKPGHATASLSLQSGPTGHTSPSGAPFTSPGVALSIAAWNGLLREPTRSWRCGRHRS